VVGCPGQRDPAGFARCEDGGQRCLGPAHGPGRAQKGSPRKSEPTPTAGALVRLLDPWAVAALRASVAVLYWGIRIIAERQPCSIDCPRSKHLGSRPLGPAPLVARLTCVRENAPHSEERAASDWMVATRAHRCPGSKHVRDLAGVLTSGRCRRAPARGSATPAGVVEV
jgi:hypothetical protein